MLKCYQINERLNKVRERRTFLYLLLAIQVVLSRQNLWSNLSEEFLMIYWKEKMLPSLDFVDEIDYHDHSCKAVERSYVLIISWKLSYTICKLA